MAERSIGKPPIKPTVPDTLPDPELAGNPVSQTQGKTLWRSLIGELEWRFR